jgi:hypothetical protein
MVSGLECPPAPVTIQSWTLQPHATTPWSQWWVQIQDINHLLKTKRKFNQSIICYSLLCQSADACAADKTTYCAVGTDHTLCQYCGGNVAKCGNVCEWGVNTQVNKTVTSFMFNIIMTWHLFTLQVDKDAIVATHNNLRRRVAKGEETLGVGGAQPQGNEYTNWMEELTLASGQK